MSDGFFICGDWRSDVHVAHRLTSIGEAVVPPPVGLRRLARRCPHRLFVDDVNVVTPVLIITTYRNITFKLNLYLYFVVIIDNYYYICTGIVY